MSTLQTIVISGLILVGGIGGLLVLGQKPEVPTQEVASVDAAVDVQTARVKNWNQPIPIKVDGEAVTYRVVTVGSEVAGRIVTKADATRSGTYVQKGDLLFEIDSTVYELEVARLDAQLNQIDEELVAIDVELANAKDLTKLAEEDQTLQKKQLDRMQQLKSRGTANDSEVEAAMKQELTARNALQSLKNQQKTLVQQGRTQDAGRKLALTQLQRAKVDLSRCRIESPLAGRVVDDPVEEGDYIKEGDLLVHISDSARMEIKTKLRAEELAWVWQQHEVHGAGPPPAAVDEDPINLPKVPCEIGYEFQGVETIWDGYISRIEGTGMDRDTRTFPCRILVEEPRKTRFNDSAGGRSTVSPPTLLSGMFVNVRIPVESPVQLLSLPLEAVRPGGQVWVNREGKLDILDIQVANVQGDHALVRGPGSGLQADDRVVVSPLKSVREGMAVKEFESQKADPVADIPVSTNAESTAGTVDAESAQ